MRKLLASLSIAVFLLAPFGAVAGTPVNSLDLEFSSSQYANVSDTASLSITGDLTIICYFKLESTPATTGANMGLVTKGSGSDGSYSFRLRDNGGSVEVNFAYWAGAGFGSGRERSWTPGSISTGSWYSISVAADVSAGTIDFSLNGSQNTGASGGTGTAIYDPNTPTYVGNDSVSAGRYLDGKISNCIIITDYLNQTQINAITNTSGGNFCSGTVPSNTAAWWTLDNVYTDSSGNGNTLTAVASPVFSADSAFTCAVASSERPTESLIILE